jgi:diguanylate cyclase (GGDEF)-like protein
MACAAQVGGIGWDVVTFAVPLIMLYACAHRTEFVATSGSAVPTEPVLVAMLLLLPLRLVPLTVLVALQLAEMSRLREAARYDAVLVQWASGWHCMGPVAVLWVASPLEPSLARAPVYLVALLAQFSVDTVVAAIRTRALGVSVARLRQPLAWTFATDSLLAPIGLACVIAGERSMATIVLLTAPIGLVRLLARDRTENLKKAVTISSAFTAVHSEARVDALTGLANRRAWAEAIRDAGRQLADGVCGGVTVLAADLDGLKHVNDAHGHQSGDELLVGMARVLRTVAPSGATVARLGGDEFGILVVGDIAATSDEQLVRDIRRAMSRFRGVERATLSASLGIASVPPENSAEEAARAADLRAAEDKIARRAGRI